MTCNLRLRLLMINLTTKIIVLNSKLCSFQFDAMHSDDSDGSYDDDDLREDDW